MHSITLKNLIYLIDLLITITTNILILLIIHRISRLQLPELHCLSYILADASQEISTWWWILLWSWMFEHQIIAHCSFHRLKEKKLKFNSILWVSWHFQTFVNANKFRSMSPKPSKARARRASTIIITRYFCKSTGNLYHSDPYEISA